MVDERNVKFAMNAQVEPQSGAAFKPRIVEFARSASTEISTHDEELLPALVNKLPAGTTVYVAHTPKATLDDVVRVAAKAQSLGFRASPHIVARRLESERALRRRSASSRKPAWSRFSWWREIANSL